MSVSELHRGRSGFSARVALFGLLVGLGVLTSCAEDGTNSDGTTATLSVHFRQLDTNAWVSLGRHGRALCDEEDASVSRVEVVIDSVPPGDTTPTRVEWTCDELRED